jgi:glycosyltransferase involved in cell wall biosynthesis
MPGALRAARQALASAPADAIVSFAQPWTDHLIALTLTRETGLPWVAHFSDPWIDSPYFRRSGMIRRRAEAWEREVMAEATRVVFVNAYTRDRVMAKYPESWQVRADVVPQAYETAPDVRAQPSMASDRPLRMIYTGRFYDGIRTPDALLQAIAGLNTESSLEGKIELEFVGADMSVYAARAGRLGLDRLVGFTGRVSPQQARARAEAADVLLVIDAADPEGSLFLPSKLVDYLPLRRPILGLTPTPGPAAELIRELGYRVAAPDDVAGITAAVRELLKAHAAGRLVASLQHDSVAARFSIAKTTRTFARVLDQALEMR